ncbi:MAG: hypothetical protein JWL95_3232 [Gemmatimonadetes bacterium]|nr:hypothetical protein [Gemmatimonadota bacterium]
MRSSFVRSFVSMLVLVGAVLFGVDCTPAQRADVAPLVEPLLAPLAKEACVFITNGAADQVCASADDLAPYVVDLLQSQARAAPPSSARARSVGASAAEPASSSSSPPRRMAIAMPAPSRAVERRRCTVWEHLPDRSDAGDAARASP